MKFPNQLPKKTFFFALLFIACLSVILRIIGICHKQSYSYDESNSFLSITINNQTYLQALSETSPVFNKIVSAKDWHPYLSQIHYPFDLVKLKNENHDNISPLYYWLLHIVFAIFGVNMYNGLFVNLLLYIILLFYFYKFCELVFHRYSLLTLYAFTFLGFSYAVYQINFEARQHLLFAVLTMIFTYYNFTWLLKNIDFTWKHFLFNFIFSLLGCLCLITFIFVIAGVLFIYVIHFKFNLRNHAIIKFCISVFSGFLCSEFTYPFIIRTIYSKINLSKNSTDTWWFVKIKVVLYSIGQFFSYNRYLVYIFLIILFFVLIISLYHLILQKKWSRLKKTNFFNYILIFTVYSFTFMILLYLFDKIPSNAVGEQYYMFIWPFFTISLIKSIDYFVSNYKLKHIFLLILSFLILINGWIYYKKSWYLQFFVRDKSKFYHYVNRSELVITDNLHPSLTFRLLTQILPPNKKVLITNIPISQILDTLKYSNFLYLPNEKINDYSFSATNYKVIPQKFETEYEKDYITFYYFSKK